MVPKTRKMYCLTNSWLLIGVAIFLCLPGQSLGAFDHAVWDKLLRENVVEINGGHSTQVDYDGFLRNRNKLKVYLADLAKVKHVEFDGWDKANQLAFLINTYNAWTIELVLTRYPQLRSIRQIGFLPFSAWRKNIVELFGSNYSLDDIEHRMIRGWGIYNEPRIHFAVNCAAIGCPALRAEAYTAEYLEQQLDDNTRLFLSDRSRNYFDDGQLHISSLFDWYEEDFEKGWQGIDSVSQFLYSYAKELDLDKTTKEKLYRKQVRFSYLSYDWNLNSVNKR